PPRGRLPKPTRAMVRLPSQRRAARKRAAEDEPPAPAPIIRRRRTVAASAGRPEDLPAASDGVPEAVGNTADTVAIVTREVLKQLLEDRDATRAADVTPTAFAPSVDPAPEVVWPMAGPNIERDNPMNFAVAGALSTLMDDKGGCSTADGAMAPTAAYRDSCTNSSLAAVMLRLLNAALSEGTKNAYK
ncbi:hypothetical protein LSAT2_015998, partial [Lamellibrachia satsuma]